MRYWWRSPNVNVSTASAIMSAAAGVPVAKHGSRSIFHRSGSADVLEALNINITLTKEQAERLIESVGFAFLYAPLFHPIMHKILGPESELGVKTVFYTVVGPLISPAHVKAHILGVYKRELVEPVANVLAKLGYMRALVVHGINGLDEISNVGPTLIAEVENGKLKDIYEITPEEVGVKRADPNEIKPGVDNPQHNAEILVKIFKGELLGPKKDFLLVNTAEALVVGGLTKDLKDGIEIAKNILAEGEVYRKLHRPSIIKALKSVNDRVPLIAEFKLASPKQIFHFYYDLKTAVHQMITGGAAVISILTEPVYYRGSLHYLYETSNSFKVPTLRKDLVLEDFQVYETAATWSKFLFTYC